MSLEFQKLSNNATIPKIAHKGDAGYDLFSAVEMLIPPSSNRMVKTDICVRFPKPSVEEFNVYGRISERSGLALKKSISIGGGVVDFLYRGNIGIIMRNHSDHEYMVHVGDRVAQLIVEICMTPPVKEVFNLTGDSTERGDSGFGSSGV